MTRLRRHAERHRTGRMGWLRAAVLGANDGIVSTASPVVGVAAAGMSQSNILVTGVAGLVAGAMPMAAGEYVSVIPRPTPRRPTCRASGPNCRKDPAAERCELATIYAARGLDADLAQQVAAQLMRHDSLGDQRVAGCRCSGQWPASRQRTDSDAQMAWQSTTDAIVPP